MKDKVLAKGLGTSLVAIHRWRKKLNTPEAFERTYDDAFRLMDKSASAWEPALTDEKKLSRQERR